MTGENSIIREKNCTSTTLSVTNPTKTGLRSNADLRNDQETTDRLYHGTATVLFYQVHYFNIVTFRLKTDKSPSSNEKV
jgi:hypothetical protein